MEFRDQPALELGGAAGERGVIARLIRLGLWAIALAAIGAFVALSARRFGCPIELGNGEGMMMDSAIRLAQGLPLYVQPTLHFIPFVYMPMFAVLVAPLVKLMGPELWQGRLVDLLGVLGFAAAAFEIVRRETRSALLGAASVALFLMGHGITRGGYDVVRPDPVMLMLEFAGLAVLRFRADRSGAIWAGALTGLGFFAKQHGLLFGFAGLGYLLFHDRRRLLPYALALLAVAGGGYLLLTLWLGPWFPFYTYDVPRHWSQISRGRIFVYLGDVLVGKFGALTLPTAMAVTLGLVDRAESGERATHGREWLWYWAALGGIGTGLLATLDPYAYFHTLMPTIAAFAVAGPIALHALAARLEGGAPIAGAGSMGARDASRPVSAVACVVLALAFLPLLYPMRTLLPRPGAAATRRDYVEKLRSLPGPVLLPFHGYFTTLAGKGTGMCVLPLDDVVRAKGNALLKRDPRYFERMFDSLRAGPDRPLIVSDTVFAKCGDASRSMWASLDGPYAQAGDLGELTERLRPLAGSLNAPTWIYVPVDSGRNAARP